MKNAKMFLALILLSLVGHAATATSMYMGPYLSLEVGKEGETQNWKTCTIRPGSATLTVNGTTTIKDTVDNSSQLADAIAKTYAAETTIAVHVTATYPEVTVVAGDAPDIPRFVLLHSGGRTESRNGGAEAAYAYLIEQVRELCDGLEAN
ncbi:MAG: hypothetical protein AB7G93_07190 [Bdellovibrionales bacterium]